MNFLFDKWKTRYNNTLVSVNEATVFLTNNHIVTRKQIPLTANPKTPATSKKTTAVWIYIVSVLGGLALLALAGIALYKVSQLYLR